MKKHILLILSTLLIAVSCYEDDTMYRKDSPYPIQNTTQSSFVHLVVAPAHAMAVALMTDHYMTMEEADKPSSFLNGRVGIKPGGIYNFDDTIEIKTGEKSIREEGAEWTIYTWPSDHWGQNRSYKIRQVSETSWVVSSPSVYGDDPTKELDIQIAEVTDKNGYHIFEVTNDFSYTERDYRAELKTAAPIGMIPSVNLEGLTYNGGEDEYSDVKGSTSWPYSFFDIKGVLLLMHIYLSAAHTH